MKVTIITVTLNSEKYLSDCIRSVRRQNYRNIEHIIVDGKSTDGTLKIIKDNLPYISKWISEKDRGMYDAINKGIQMATGDIIGILNSDDMLASEDVIRNIAYNFKISSKIDAVYGDLLYVDQQNTEKVTRFWKGEAYKRSRFNFGWMPAHPTFYIRRSLISQFGLYENHFYTSADYEFMARYLYKYNLNATYVEQMVVKMRKGGVSNGNIWRRLRANRRDYLAMKKNHIPFPFLVSILKPLSKIHQYNNAFLRQVAKGHSQPIKPKVSFLPSDGIKVITNVEVL